MNSFLDSLFFIVGVYRVMCFFGCHFWVESYEHVPYWERQCWRCSECGALKVEP